jgi:hypothetical protein
MPKRGIILASDHAGMTLKAFLCEHLSKEGLAF